MAFNFETFGTTEQDSPTAGAFKNPQQKSEFTLQEKAETFARGVASGAGKSVARTLQNIGRVVTDPLADTLGVDRPGIPEEQLQPKTTAEKVGSFASDVAQFVLPVGKIGQAAKAVRLITSPKARLAERIVNSVPQSVAEGLTTTGVISAQTGEVDEEALLTGVASGAVPFVGATSQAIVKYFGKDFAPRIVNSMVKPLKKDFSYGKDPGRGIAQEGIVANSFEELSSKIQSKLDTRITEAKTLARKAGEEGVRVDISSSLKPIDDAIASLSQTPRTNAAAISRLQSVKDDLLGIEIVDGVEKATRQLSDLTPEQAIEFKQLIGQLTKFTGNQSDDAVVNKALKQIYGSVKGEVNKAVPGTAEINERIADLISARVAVDYRDAINARQGLLRFDEKALAAGAAAVETLATGGVPDIGTLATGLVTLGATKALAQPKVKLGIARFLADASPEDRKKLLQEVPWVRGITVESLFSDEINQGAETE